MNISKANQFLSVLVTTSTTGDFLTQFSVMVLLHKLTHDSLIAGLVVPVSYIGSAIGSSLFPYLLGTFSIKSCLASAQLACAISISLIACYWLNTSDPNPYFILTLFIFLSSLAQVFSNARDVYSKGVIDEIKRLDSSGNTESHLQAQSKIENALMAGQLLGPIIFFILVWYFDLPLWISFVLDITSFLVTLLWIPHLPDIRVPNESSLSIRRPLEYLREDSTLMRIFLVRSVGLWIPLASFNYILFSILTEFHGLNIVHASWIYPLLAFGSILGAKFVEFQARNLEKKLPVSSYTNFLYGVGSIGCILYGSGILLYMYGHWQNCFIFGLFVIGFGNGFQKISTRTIIRKTASLKQFSEITALELTIGKALGFLVCIILKMLSGYKLNYENIVWFSVISLILPATLMWSGLKYSVENRKYIFRQTEA